MYPTLRHLLYDWAGINWSFAGLLQCDQLFFTLGLLLASCFYYLELSRRQAAGNFPKLLKTVKPWIQVGPITGQFVLGFILGYKLGFALLQPTLFMGPAASKILLDINKGSWLWGLIIASFFAGLKFWQQRQKIKKYPDRRKVEAPMSSWDLLTDTLPLLLVYGLLMSKLIWYCYHVNAFGNDYNILHNSGVFMGIFGGLFCFYIYCLIKKRPFLPFAESLAPAMLVLYATSCLGAHLSGAGYWGVELEQAAIYSGLPEGFQICSYPNNLMNQGLPMSDCVYPSDFGDYCLELGSFTRPIALWEAILAMMGFALLWRLRLSLAPNGKTFFLSLGLLGAIRFFGESFRSSSYASSTHQLLAASLLVAGVLLFFFIKPPSSPSPKATSIPSEKEGLDIPLD